MAVGPMLGSFGETCQWKLVEGYRQEEGAVQLRGSGGASTAVILPGGGGGDFTRGGVWACTPREAYQNI